MAIAPGSLGFQQLTTSPAAPPVGYCILYSKTDNVVYLKDSSNIEIALGSASSITSLTGEATGTGPGATVVTLSNSAIIGKVLTGFATGPNSTVLATDTILQAIQKLQAQVSATVGAAITALTGDVSATGPGSSSSTVNTVGGKSAASIATSVNDTIAATSANTASTIVKRDASGNFAANNITASLLGNATTATTATNFTGSLLGDVTGTQSATVVALVGGKTAAAVATSVNDTQAATDSNTASTIVKRDASGNFAANLITAALSGNATTSTSFIGSLVGDVTGTQGATVVSFVGTSSAANVHLAELAANAATSTNTASTIIKRDASGDFAAGTITADLVGNVTGNVSGTAANVTGIVTIAHGGTNSATALNNNRIIKSAVGAIIEAAAITAARALISDANGIPTHSITTSTELSYVSGVTSAIQTQLNAITGSGITSLTGDVTATGPGAAAATVAAIQGTMVSGTTGSGNVAFSNAPTFTGLLSGSSASFSSTVTASNLSGTNTGDVTITDTDSIDITLAGQNITADLKLSSDVADAGNIKATTTVHSGAGAGLHVELPYGTPVQIGTSNFIGAASSFALSDHVHAHGNQTSATLHAAATAIANGFMTSSDFSKLAAATAANTVSTIVMRDGSGNFSAGTITASLSGNATTATTATLAGNVTGIVAIANGGTNSSAALSNNRVMQSSGGALVEAAAITAARALISDANGIPTHSAVTSTELGYLSGVTSAIQTQINGKQATGNYITALTGDVTASGPGSSAATIAANAVSNSKLAQMPANTIKGNNTGATANALDLTTAQVNTLLGTVTSVAASSPLQSSGGATPTVSFANQTANTVLSGPTTGAAAAPTFRALVRADIPNYTVVTKTANYTILSTDDTIFVDTSGGAFTLTLPSPTALSGKIFRIIDTAGTLQSNNLTLARSASEKIEGIAASKIFQTNWGGWQVTTNATDWFVW